MWAWLLVALGATGLLLLLYAWLIEPRWLRIRRRVIHIPGLPAALEGVTLLHISDLHIGRRRLPPEGFVERLAQIPADVVVVTGDFIAEPAALERCCAAFKKVGGGRPFIGILGNHEHTKYKWSLPGKKRWVPRERLDAAAITRSLEAAGIRMLVNQAIAIEVKGTRLYFAGLDDVYHRLQRLPEALEGVPEGEAFVLLCHSPEILTAAAERKVPLVLSGHTHGGQVRFPLVGAPFTGTHRPIPAPSGLVREGETQMHISPGLGVSVIPFRFLVRPEMTLLELRRA